MDGAIGSIAHEHTNKNGSQSCACRAKYATDLDELIALFATTSESVEHRVAHGVEDTHGEARDERTAEVCAIDGRIHKPSEEHDGNANESDHDSNE